MACCCRCRWCDVEDEDASELRYRQFVDPLPAGAPATSVAVRRADFETLSVLGSGSYGKVLQVRRRAGGELFALKVRDRRPRI